MQNLPVYIGLAFGLTTCLVIYLFYLASRSKISMLVLLIWLLLQGIISLSGFYAVTHTLPPRFLLALLPPLLVIAVLFLTARGKHFTDSLDPGRLVLLQVFRIPVEILLFCLSVYGVVPRIMTFEGHNFDLFSGLTAPAVYYFGFIRRTLPGWVLLVWNFICLALLLNVVVIAVLSIPLPFQQLSFDQPNIAVLYFPFVWLPSCMVPLALFSHLATIRHLLRGRKIKFTESIR
jgi:hypothetical protein